MQAWRLLLDLCRIGIRVRRLIVVYGSGRAFLCVFVFSCTWRQAMTAPTAAVRLNVPWLPGDMKLWFGVLRASHAVMVA